MSKNVLKYLTDASDVGRICCVGFQSGMIATKQSVGVHVMKNAYSSVYVGLLVLVLIVAMMFLVDMTYRSDFGVSARDVQTTDQKNTFTYDEASKVGMYSGYESYFMFGGDIEDTFTREHTVDMFFSQGILPSSVMEISKDLRKSCFQAGTVIDFEYGDRDAAIYLPYGYDETYCYDIVYLIHGGCTGCPNKYNQIFKTGDFANVLDWMICEGSIKPVIFVGLSWAPDTTPKIFAETGIKDAITAIESKYNTYANKDVSDKSLVDSASHRMLAGFSNGAYCTWDIIANDNHKYFSSFAPCSAYGAGSYDYTNSVRALSKYIDSVRLYDYIGEMETGNSGIPQYKKRTTMFDLYPAFSYLENYTQCIGDGHVHNVMDCEDYVYTTLLSEFGFEGSSLVMGASITLPESEEEKVETKSANVTEELPEETTESTGHIAFIGDSRFVGMSISVETDNIFVCEGGAGYYRLTASDFDAKVQDALKKVDTVVFNFGINDLADIDKYVAYVTKMAEDNPNLKIYYMTINPVIDSLAAQYNYSVRDADVVAFNDKLRERLPENIILLDSYAYMTSAGFEAFDGIHYGTTTQKNLYEYVLSVL